MNAHYAIADIADAIEPKKIYLKEATFQSPVSPRVFTRGEINPEFEVQMSMSHRRLDADDDIFEVVLAAVVTARLKAVSKDKPLFQAEVQQAGIFEVGGSAENREVVLETACPNVLLPFARETLASLISKGGFPQLLISPINFQALYQQKKATEARIIQPPAAARPN